MARYNVYGVGNALVDKEFEVDDEFFQQHGIEKGYMTLVDDEQQNKLLQILEAKYEIKTQSGGGSAANTLYALSQFGGSAYFSCKVATDDHGDFYLQQLGHHNIETNSNNRRSDGTTGRCVVMISPDAERTMHTYLGISESVSTREIDFQAATQAEYVYLEGYLVTSDSARTALKELKQFAQQNRVKVAMTFSDPSMLQYFSSNVNEVLGTGVDLLFCNEKEALLWSGEDNLPDACRAIQSVARRFAITRGARGALLWDGRQFLEIDAQKVDAVDTNGAGDMFAGAFLYALTNGHSFWKAGELASIASGTVVSSFGPRLQPAQHEAIIRDFIKW